MSLFKITNEITSKDVKLIDETLSIKLIDKYAQSNEKPDITTWKHELFLSKDVIKNSIKDLEELKYSIELLMNGQAQVVREISHIDDETGELVIDTPIEYNEIPTSRIEIEDLLFNLVKADYELKKIGEYTFDDTTLKRITDYVVDNFIKYSDGSGVATFTMFENLIKY